jgi:hypothetical protein
MLSVTSGVRTEGGFRFEALATEPVANHFLANACMAPLTGRPLTGNMLPKISRVSLIESVFMYPSTIATLRYRVCHLAHYGSVHHFMQRSTKLMSQDQQHAIEDDQRCEGGMVTARLLTDCSLYAIYEYKLTPEIISQGHVPNGRRAIFSWPILYNCIGGLYLQTPRHFARQPSAIVIKPRPLLRKSRDCSYESRGTLAPATLRRRKHAD